MEIKLNKAFLIIGTNLGNRNENIEAAKIQLEKKVGRIKKISSVYETEPWGITDQPSFYNVVLVIETHLGAKDLLTALLQIEKEMGRIRHLKYGTRIIDLDILFYEDEVLSTDYLTIPHPRIQERNFVLKPLVEIAEDFIHPVFQKTTLQLLQECEDKLKVNKIH